MQEGEGGMEEGRDGGLESHTDLREGRMEG